MTGEETAKIVAALRQMAAQIEDGLIDVREMQWNQHRLQPWDAQPPTWSMTIRMLYDDMTPMPPLRRGFVDGIPPPT